MRAVFIDSAEKVFIGFSVLKNIKFTVRTELLQILKFKNKRSGFQSRFF